jgi:hypothetical protein
MIEDRSDGVKKPSDQGVGGTLGVKGGDETGASGKNYPVD